MSDLLDRLRKLRALAEDSDSPEAQTARHIYEDLLQRHGLTDDEVMVEATAVFEAKVAPGTRVIFVRVCLALGLDPHGVIHPRAAQSKHKSKKPRVVWLVRCTERQRQTLDALYGYSCKLYVQERRKCRAALSGFMFGHLAGMYPRDDDKLACPVCKKPAVRFVESESRYVCAACGHRGPKVKPIECDPDAYERARRAAHRPIQAGRQAAAELPFKDWSRSPQ